MASIVKSFGILGVEGYLVDVEVKEIFGQSMISIVGLGDTAIKEARERVQAAINDSNYTFPQKKIVVNLAPSDLKKSGSHYDLPIALGMLIETDQCTIRRSEEFAYIGELSLNAKLRGCSGVLPMIIAAKEAGVENIIVPLENVREASLVSGVNIFGFDNLTEVVEFLENRREYYPEEIVQSQEEEHNFKLDFIDVQGQEAVIEYIVVAAAGGHNMIMIGAPGCGKSMIAKRIPSILPRMTDEEALEVTKIYSVAGILKEKAGLILERPFRAPHHNASTNSLIGGGNNATPGEISLAHNGVLFLDEIAEFNKKTLEALRQPMEDQKVTVSRVKQTNTYPASFMLVGAMNPCPCGYYGDERCKCTDYEVLKYRQKISGPIMDRMDIQKYVRAVNFMDLTKHSLGKSSKELRERVEFARNIQNKRFKGIPNINCNAQMNNALIKEYCQLEAEGQKLLEMAYDRFNYSARTFHKFLKVARTFADMEGADKIRKKDIAGALMSRDLEKDRSIMAVL
ncbi:ATP-binding protein [Tissierella creatinini]|nr:ATP-binding protein [Tissierella creatinini]TJX60087.1 ATP-binding protein [Soehngenia saccharolytica]